MKRSRINDIIAAADEMIRQYGFVLPPFANWPPDSVRAQARPASRIVDGRCGWDITDYGQGRSDEMGLFLFTLSNGLLSDLQRGGGMCYAEKLLISRRDQCSPMLTHVINAEDIVNHGCATLMVELNGSDDQGRFAPDCGGVVYCDGIRCA
jgi:D-lyxose ketol-isomerase